MVAESSHSPKPDTRLVGDPQTALNAALDYLSGSKCAGGYPYNKGGDLSLEATAWALIALRRNQEIALAGLQDIARAQNADGGWSTRPGAGRSDWSTGPALLSLRLLAKLYEKSIDNSVRTALKKGQDSLLDSRVEFFGPAARLLLLFSKGPTGVEYNRGWPWDPKCFHWLEPTAYCLMALKIPGVPAKATDRQIIKYADRFIFEHACRGGGWNHGNDLSLGVYLPPYRLTTAEALLAIQNSPSHNYDVASEAENRSKIDLGLRYLQSQSKEDSSSLSLAMSVLALDAYGHDSRAELSYLLKRQEASGAFGPTIVSTALAALALETACGNKENVLRINGANNPKQGES